MKDDSRYTTDVDLLKICKEEGISPFFATQAGVVREYSRVNIFVDDSGSTMHMMFPENESRITIEKKMADSSLNFLFKARQDVEGIHAYSLNAYPYGRPVTSLTDITDLFRSHGITPTIQVVGNACSHEVMSNERGVLSIILTDGEPEGGFEAFRSFLSNMQNSYGSSYFQIGLATDDNVLINKYTESVDVIPRVDVCTWIPRERGEIREKQGKNFVFTDGDYTVKFLVGPRIPAWDNLDQRPLTNDELKLINKFEEEVYQSGFGPYNLMPWSKNGGSSKSMDRLSRLFRRKK